MVIGVDYNYGGCYLSNLDSSYSVTRDYFTANVDSDIICTNISDITTWTARNEANEFGKAG
ncbi:MAG: hypothetical protein NVS4B7_04800 [Ktedonobacteraceae bacterium]